jgi:hypothetical protein
MSFFALSATFIILKKFFNFNRKHVKIKKRRKFMQIRHNGKFFRRYKVSSSGYTKSTDKGKENKIPFSSVGTQKLDAKEKL